ncbi:MAG: helix-turn-helix domain-containing protein [Pseudonocardiaceae bacterium]
MDAEDNITIGQRLRRIRKARGKSLRVVADLTGGVASFGHLSDIENGKAPLDSLKLITALAKVLQIAPSELTGIPVLAPGNGHTDSATEAVRRALVAVDVGRPGGLVVPAGVLRDRVTQILRKRQACRFAEVATDLPGLIRDLHTTLDTGRDHGELLELAVALHVHGTQLWLRHAGAPGDLRRHAAFLARHTAAEHGEITTLGAAAFGTVHALVADGMFDVAQDELDAVALPSTMPETAGLVGALTMTNASIAAADNRPGDVAAPMEAAAELAQRFGEIGEDDPLGFVFGPTDVGLWSMAFALEAGEPDRAVSIAEGVHPQRHPHATRRTTYWVDFGRAAARLRGRRDDAVRALLTAEDLFPVRLYRNPFARDAIAGLVEQSRRDAGGRDLRGLASRAGLNV